MIDRAEMLRGIDVRRALFGTFFAFSNRLQTVGDRFYEEITCKQFFVLMCLSVFQDTSPTINELAEVMGSSRQNVKQMVNKLEKQGFLSIHQDEQDKRKLRVAFAPEMYKLADKYGERENTFIEHFYAGIPEADLELVFQTITKLENNLSKLEEEVSQ